MDPGFFELVRRWWEIWCGCWVVLWRLCGGGFRVFLLALRCVPAGADGSCLRFELAKLYGENCQ
jgi:hypothetical protein